MKILFYADTVFSFGGVQRVLAVVAKALSATHDVTILISFPTSQQGIFSISYARLAAFSISVSFRRILSLQDCIASASSFQDTSRH